MLGFGRCGGPCWDVRAPGGAGGCAGMCRRRDEGLRSETRVGTWLTHSHRSDQKSGRRKRRGGKRQHRRQKEIRKSLKTQNSEPQEEGTELVVNISHKMMSSIQTRVECCLGGSCEYGGHVDEYITNTLFEKYMKPQVNFYWLRGETKVPRGHRKGCIDPLRFQVDDAPLVQVRVPEPLKEFVPLDFVVAEEIPVVAYEPSRLPLFQRQYDNNIFIGSKLDDPCSFGHTQFHLVPDKFKRERLQKLNRGDHAEVFLRANAIASLFAWTGAQAMYQGFWSQADVTRPFVSQGVISDGRHFSFFCYQLNTLALAVDADKDPNRKNICWGTESAPLYETVEKDDIKGFNDDVFRQLVRFFLNSPA